MRNSISLEFMLNNLWYLPFDNIDFFLRTKFCKCAKLKKDVNA
ncbi:hypothetical protein TSAR_008321 [Trichomalopsis sarcophagae]|uniref:Uncharacterized protein n=1 Tax=Trichomalopsis sarcophagae TaxID=543379 RepID=A0A232FC05_9HYME|nr:hypothetical protein TSAR_008321 [Trichomalopsis sarcophagae]